MNYDLFLLYAREDAVFAKSVAKGLEKINISVLYKESLGRKGLLKDAIEKSFDKAFNGIIVISKSFFELAYKDRDLDFLYEVLFMENQTLHPIWYRLRESDISRWYPKLALGVALQFPPETVDSIARKFQVKLAGSPNLQREVLTGFHSKIQYIEPKISTYRPRQGKFSLARELPAETTFERRDSKESIVDDSNLKEELEDEPVNINIDDQLIATSFHEQIREEIRKRLDVYLVDLSNWKDLAGVFRVNSATEIRRLLDTKQPSLGLLEVLARLDVTVREFKRACAKIGRFDILDFLNNNLKLPECHTS